MAVVAVNGFLRFETTELPMSICEPARTESELNREQFIGHQRAAVRYCETLFERIHSRRFAGQCAGNPNHPWRLTAERTSIADMRELAGDVSELAAKWWTPGVQARDLQDNSRVADQLADVVELSVEPDGHAVPVDELVTITVDDTFPLPVRLVADLYRTDFDGKITARLQSYCNGRATYQVEVIG